MFIHKTCNSNLLLDITPSITFLVSTGIGKDGLRPNQGNFILNKSEWNPSFYCYHCKKGNIPLNEIEIRCMYCGNRFIVGENLEHLLVPSKSGGIYCSDCINKYFPDESVTTIHRAITKIDM